MRVLLQNTETKLYFINTNEWTDDPLKATDFEEVEHAAEVYAAQDMAYAQIIVQPGALPHTPPVLEHLARYIQARG